MAGKASKERKVEECDDMPPVLKERLRQMYEPEQFARGATLMKYLNKNHPDYCREFAADIRNKKMDGDIKMKIKAANKMANATAHGPAKAAQPASGKQAASKPSAPTMSLLQDLTEPPYCRGAFRIEDGSGLVRVPLADFKMTMHEPSYCLVTQDEFNKVIMDWEGACAPVAAVVAVRCQKEHFEKFMTTNTPSAILARERKPEFASIHFHNKMAKSEKVNLLFIQMGSSRAEPVDTIPTITLDDDNDMFDPTSVRLYVDIHRSQMGADEKLFEGLASREAFGAYVKGVVPRSMLFEDLSPSFFGRKDAKSAVRPTKKWNAEEDAVMSGSVRIHPDHIQDIMSRSGLNGVMLNLETSNPIRLESVILPTLVATPAQAIAQAKSIGKASYGLKLTKKGYAVRVRPERLMWANEQLVPDQAAKYGDLMSLTSKTARTYHVRGVDANLPRERFHDLILHAIHWSVMPRAFIRGRRRGTVDVVVWADQPPPCTEATIQGRNFSMKVDIDQDQADIRREAPVRRLTEGKAAAAKPAARETQRPHPRVVEAARASMGSWADRVAASPPARKTSWHAMSALEEDDALDGPGDMATNETDLPAVLVRSAEIGLSSTNRGARLPAPIPKRPPPASTGFLDDLIASIAADKAESDQRFADMEEKFGKLEQAMGAMNSNMNSKFDKMMVMMGQLHTAQQGGGKLGQSKGQTGTIHGKARKAGRSPRARSRSRSSASEGEADETQR